MLPAESVEAAVESAEKDWQDDAGEMEDSWSSAIFMDRMFDVADVTMATPPNTESFVRALASLHDQTTTTSQGGHTWRWGADLAASLAPAGAATVAAGAPAPAPADGDEDDGVDAQVRGVFASFDLDASGAIDADELLGALRACGLSGIEPSMVQFMLRKYDGDRNSSLDVYEVIAAL